MSFPNTVLYYRKEIIENRVDSKIKLKRAKK